MKSPSKMKVELQSCVFIFPSMPVQFFNEDIDFSLSNPPIIESWINEVCSQFGQSVEQLNYIFCPDDYLLEVNKEYLDHDYYTDIITFDNSEDKTKVEGDIFISIDRVKDNAQDLGTSAEHEMRRVIIHGLLHLVGFNDKTEEEKMLMLR